MRQVLTRGVMVTDKPILAMGANPHRRAFMIQNTSTSDLVYVSFFPGDVRKESAFRIGQNGVYTWDSAMEGELYLFMDTGKAAHCVVMETIGFDAFELALLQAIKRGAS